MRHGKWIKTIANELLDLIYPPGLYCISCGKLTDDTRTYRLCNECMDTANWITERHCAKCGRPLSANNPGRLCFMCAENESSGKERAFDKGYACAGYGSVEQAVVFDLKYGGHGDIGETLGEIMYDRMAAEFDADEIAGMYDIVMPVPIYKEKQKKRGFNHADLIAKGFAMRAGIRYESGAIKRTRATQPMKGLDPQSRITNISGAFELRERKRPLVSGARILLIDDIYTTGATIDEAARILKESWTDEDGKPRDGASIVDFLAFAAAGDMTHTAS